MPPHRSLPLALLTLALGVAFTLPITGCSDRDATYAYPLADARLDGIQKRRPLNSPEWFETVLRRYLDDYPKNPRANLLLAGLLADKTDPASAKARSRALKRANTEAAEPWVRIQAAQLLINASLDSGDETGAKKLVTALLAASASSTWTEGER